MAFLLDYTLNMEIQKQNQSAMVVTTYKGQSNSLSFYNIKCCH